MSSRFTFPPVNFGASLEAQLKARSEWVGWYLIRIEIDGKAPRWKLRRGEESHVYGSLCEVDMKLAALLEEIGERVQRELTARLVAERTVRHQFDEAMKSVN